MSNTYGVGSFGATLLDAAMAAYQRGDYAIALAIFGPLADEGNAEAQGRLATMYADGIGVPQDYAEAATWYCKAADQGHSHAQTVLGLMYFVGQGVPQDAAEGVKWLRKAADQGNAIAQEILGEKYHEGVGIPQDYIEAHKWFNLAASRIPASEADDRTKAVKNRDNVAAKMTPAQIAEAQKLAREWKPK